MKDHFLSKGIRKTITSGTKSTFINGALSKQLENKVGSLFNGLNELHDVLKN